MKPDTRHIKRLSEKAASNAELRATLKKAMLHFTGSRDRAFAQFENSEIYRSMAAQARQRALDNLPALLRQLEDKLTALGVTVHWAEDAAQARTLIADIATERSVRLVVKGKSMITEEIDLNQELQARGMEVMETDLAEYIIQLAEEPPSHLVAPALHKSRQDVAKLFQEKLGRTGEQAEELAGIAREVLREKFLNADMAITGVNAAVAETGTLTLVENEGNIRMSTTCAPLHVAVMSLEKVCADFSDLASILRMLPMSAVGKKMSSYVSLFTGPRQENETDGPKEMHLVILDNGRSRILADPEMRQVLRCVRCAACLNVCPVYQAVGGHSYGWVYSGPIGAVLMPLLLPKKDTLDLPMACTMCGACKDVCPVEIDHPALLLRLRQRNAEGHGPKRGTLWQRLLLKTYGLALRRQWLYRAGIGVTRFMDPKLTCLPRLPGLKLVSRYGHVRRMPVLKRPFNKRWPELKRQLESISRPKSPESSTPNTGEDS